MVEAGFEPRYVIPDTLPFATILCGELQGNRKGQEARTHERGEAIEDGELRATEKLWVMKSMMYTSKNLGF